MSASQISAFEAEDRIVAALKKRSGVATAGDVAADTGLGYADAEAGLRRMLSIYKSHLDVDDDGNLCYRFDPKFVRRGEDPRRLWHDIKSALWTTFKWFFKVWIMVTLVGYTIIFVLLLLALVVGSIALSASTDSDADGLIELPIYLLARFLEFFFWISIFDDGSSHRRRRRTKRRKEKPEKAFYQKVFDYVFGPDDKVDPLLAQQSFAQFVREHRGRVTAADWAARTGQSLDEAENALTAGLVRFNGDVDVSEEGVLVYRFDELMVTAQKGKFGSGRGPENIWNARARIPKFTGNPQSTNVWISIFNLFNLFMSGFFFLSAADAAAQGVAVDPALSIGLGIIPFVFSLVFFAVPLLRSIPFSSKKRAAQREDARRREIKKIYDSVASAEPRPVSLERQFEKDLSAGFDADVKVGSDGTAYYFFERVADELEAGRAARVAAEEEVVFGRTVFSSDEETVSLDQSELDDFDRRLARELEGSHVTFGVAQTAGARG